MGVGLRRALRVVSETFWDHLNEADRAAVKAEGVWQKLDDGDYVFHQSDSASAAYVVISGRLKLVRTATTGKEILVEIRGPGSLVGELGIIDDRSRSAAALAMGPVEL